MLLKHSKSWLVALVVLFVGTGFARAADQWTPSDNKLHPFGPTKFEADPAPFAFVELDEFGGRDNISTQGFFFTYERLSWSVSIPDTRPIGAAVPTVGINSITEAIPAASNGWGNRFDVGYWDGNTGWQVSVLDGPEQPQGYVYGHLGWRDLVNFPAPPTPSVYIGFSGPAPLGFLDLNGDGFADDVDGDGTFGNDGVDTDADGTPDTAGPADLGDLLTLVPAFDTVLVNNITAVNGVELMKTFRFRPLAQGGILELLIGGRFLEVDDRFGVTGLGGNFANTHWNTRAANNIVGPQAGARWYHTKGRFTVSAEGRFFAGYNFTNLSHEGQIGSLITNGAVQGPAAGATNPTSFQYKGSDRQFSPVGEFRFNLNVDITRSVAMTVGWSGLYVDNIVRASNIVQYTFPAMGIRQNYNTEDIFTHGVNFGFVYNR